MGRLHSSSSGPHGDGVWFSDSGFLKLKDDGDEKYTPGGLI